MSYTAEELATFTHDAAIEEVAVFVETHYCIIDPVKGYPHYITEARAKHPCEPLACAIRNLKWSKL